MLKKTLFLLVIFTFLTGLSYSQKKNNEAFYKEINGKEKLTTDFSQIERPKTHDEFKSLFHLPPVRQDTTGTCWCFSGTSFLESELKRLGKEPVKLSEMFTVYHEYIEKCRRFIREKGNSEVSEGSQHNAVLLRIKEYGAVRLSDYSGLLGDNKSHNHRELVKELKSYLDYIKKNNYWDEEKNLSYVKLILNKYLGEPPSTISVDGKSITPKEYQEKNLQLPLDDYVVFMSTKSVPFYTKGEYNVTDNWWHSKEYYNIPLDEFYSGIKNAVINGYTLVFAGDVSEAGLNSYEDVAIVPTFDCPPEYVNQDSREFRFDNKTTGDDHGIHAVGYKKIGKDDWFLIKDSGGTGWRGEEKGYIFYRGDYIKLKMLAFMVHKDAVKDLLSKFK
jgi:bleomycin hydrolase